MTSQSNGRSVLILGGLQSFSRLIVNHVVEVQRRTDGVNGVDDNEERELIRSIKYIRIVDKYSINPPTTYLDTTFKSNLLTYSSEPKEEQATGRLWVDYRQANLNVRAKVVQAFELPERYKNGKSEFDIVIELLGETTYDRPEIIQIEQSYSLPLSIATYASTLSIPAYIKPTYPYYEMKSSSPSTGHEESSSTALSRRRSGSLGGSDDQQGIRPDGVRGKWWNEVIRSMGHLKGLNLVVLRIGEAYGGGYTHGTVLARLVIGNIYKYLNEEMKFLYKPDLRIHTIHTTDVVRAVFTSARWMTELGRRKADEKAGVNVASSWALDEKPDVKIEVVDPKKKIIVPLFNLVDENDSTQDKLAKAVAQHFGIKYGFHGAIAALVAQFSIMDFSEAIEDVNEQHLEAWHQMMTKSKPPIEDTIISPFLETHAFSKRAINLDGRKLRQTMLFNLRYPKLRTSDLAAIVKQFQEEGLWPTL